MNHLREVAAKMAELDDRKKAELDAEDGEHE